MAIGWQEHLRPGMALKTIVQQATAALTDMDAERLEELALCCADLNRGDFERDAAEDGDHRAKGAFAEGQDDLIRNELGLLRCVLRETRANLTVLSRLHAIRLRETYFPTDRRSTGRQDSESEAFGAWILAERRPDYGDN